MEREIEINAAAQTYSTSGAVSSKEDFVIGAKWADNHAKEPWLNIEKNLPCDFEYLLQDDMGCDGSCKKTDFVLVVLSNGLVTISRMIMITPGVWKWQSYQNEIVFWAPISYTSPLRLFSDDELKIELKRRAALKRVARESVKRCRHCEHFGEITYFGKNVPEEEKKRGRSIRASCKFFKTKNGKYYRTHSPSDKACEYFKPNT